MSGSNQGPPYEQGTHDCSHRLVHPVLLYHYTGRAARTVQKELQGASGAKPMRSMPMQMRANRLHVNTVV